MNIQQAEIKPIETVYKGYRFRSRLEARWAVFFDALGITWQYEPEGFVLSDGQRYLPDFYLPTFNKGMWAEVKPDGGDFELVRRFAGDIDKPVWCCCGVPEFATAYCILEKSGVEPFPNEVGEWYGLPLCNSDARSENRMWWWWDENRSDLVDNECDDFYRAAITAARSARFEHGEEGVGIRKPKDSRHDRALNTYATKKYGEDWQDGPGWECVAEEFVRWLERKNGW